MRLRQRKLGNRANDTLVGVDEEGSQPDAVLPLKHLVDHAASVPGRATEAALHLDPARQVLTPITCTCDGRKDHL
jgi:hypothetical protein